MLGVDDLVEHFQGAVEHLLQVEAGGELGDDAQQGFGAPVLKPQLGGALLHALLQVFAQAARLGIQLGVLDGDGSLAADGAPQSDLIRVEAVRLLRVHEEQPVQILAGGEGQDEQRARPMAGKVLCQGGEVGVCGARLAVINAQGLLDALEERRLGQGCGQLRGEQRMLRHDECLPLGIEEQGGDAGTMDRLEKLAAADFQDARSRPAFRSETR